LGISKRGLKESNKSIIRKIRNEIAWELKLKMVKDSIHYYNEDYIGCSAEAHVSHLLSDELSSRPLG